MVTFRHAVPVAVVALAAVSLLAPMTLLYDPWAWLIWGRELTAFDLDTAGGPSWKPLPAMVATALAPTGEAAPQLWLLIARVGGLAAIALAWRLASRLVFPRRLATTLATRFAPDRIRAGRLLAGAVAALGIVVLFDPFTSWTRQIAGGLSEPLSVALALGAVDRALSDRPGQALGLGFAASLIRPEAWPLLAAYGLWLWRAEPRLRGWLVAGAVALPALWLAPDLAGSGDALTGAERAREGSGAPLGEALEAVGRSFNLALAAVWVAAAYAVVSGARTGERAIVVLAAGAGVWIATVAALAAGGYAGLPRFAAPAAAVVCVLGGVGLVRMIAAVDGLRRSRRRNLALAGLAAVTTVLLLQAGVRFAQIPGELDEAAAYAEGVEELTALAEEVGRDRAETCSPVETTAFLSSTALAWRLDLQLDEVSYLDEVPRAGTVFVDDAEPELDAAAESAGERLGKRGRWSAYAISCASASGAAIAGGSGAVR